MPGRSSPCSVPELVGVREQRVHERARPVALRGMHDQPGRLGEHDHVLVLEADVERDVLGHQVARGSYGGTSISMRSPALHGVPLGRGLAVDEHEPVVDEPRGRRAARR